MKKCEAKRVNGWSARFRGTLPSGYIVTVPAANKAEAMARLRALGHCITAPEQVRQTVMTGRRVAPPELLEMPPWPWPRGRSQERE